MRAALVIVCAACAIAACADTGTGARIARLQTQQAEQDRALDQAEIDVNRLSALWDDVIVRYEAVEHSYRVMRRRYVALSERADETALTYEAAADDWRRAQTLWRLYRNIVLIAVALEAGRYEGRSFSCEGMSTARFRRMLISQGMNLVGMDIDHIVPRSLGGADHPMNYQVIDSSVNRSLGARWDADKCLMPGRKRCAEALSVSRRCGAYSGPWF